MAGRGSPPGSKIPVSGRYEIDGARGTTGPRGRKPSGIVVMLRPDTAQPGTPYMPVLWTKRAERRALQGLPGEARKHITPLIVLRPIPKPGRDKDDETGEYVERDPPTYEEHLVKQADWLLKIAAPSGPLFGDFPSVYVDVHVLQRQNPTRIVLRDLMMVLGPDAVKFVPVVSPGDGGDHFAAAARWHLRHRRGIALRVMRRRGSRWPDRSDLVEFARRCGCSPRLMDLVIDARHVLQHEVDGMVDSLPDVLADYAWKPWRSMTLVAGGFPKSISALRHSSRLVRWDLVLWKRVAHALHCAGSRVPRFGDYTMVHPDLGSGGVPPEVPPNVRYTGERYWFVYRRDRSADMRDLCRSLIADHPAVRRLETQADVWIADRADGKKRRSGGEDVEVHGKPETWTFAGLSRHLWFAAMQMRGAT